MTEGQGHPIPTPQKTTGIHNLTRREFLRYVAFTAAGATGILNMLAKAAAVGSGAAAVGQEIGGALINRQEVIDALGKRGIRITDSLPKKVADNNFLGFQAASWENRNLVAFNHAVNNIPDWWWEKIQKEGGVDVFLFPILNKAELTGMIVPPWDVPSYAMALSYKSMNVDAFLQIFADITVAHETTHLMTWQSDESRKYWQDFMTTPNSLNLQTNADGNIVFPGVDAMGTVGYGNTSPREFIAVASSLYTQGRDIFTDMYREILSAEQTGLLYQKLKSDLYHGVPEYQGGGLHNANEWIMKVVPPLKTSWYSKFPDVQNLPPSDPLRIQYLCGSYPGCGTPTPTPNPK